MNFQQFLKECNELKQQFPRIPNHFDQCENADYGDYLFQTKNAYYCFEDANCSDSIYLFDSFKAENCCDGDYIIESQWCYDCVDISNSNNCTYCIYCSRLYDSHFCYHCMDSSNLFGCVYLKFQEYCIVNKQYPKEEYEKKVAELKKRPFEENMAEMKKLRLRYPVTQTLVSNSEHSDYGNQVFFSKNLYMCFDSAYSEDCGYLYDSHHNKNSFDLTQTHHCELTYECVDGFQLHNCFFTNYCGFLTDSGFCENCSNSHHLFGCVDLDNKEYCILNRQYSPEKYEKKVGEIMKSYRQLSS